MLIILIDVFIYIRMRKRTVVQVNAIQNQQRNLQNQMFILTLTSIGIFFLTNLPVSISITVLSRGNTVRQDSLSSTTIVSSLTWLRCLNYSVNTLKSLSQTWSLFCVFLDQFLHLLFNINIFSTRISETNIYVVFLFFILTEKKTTLICHWIR